MEQAITAGSDVASQETVTPPGWRRLLRQGENSITVLALAAMVILPLVEIILRAVFGIGISGSSAIVQHLTLMVGMFGGALAARDGRLLSLSSATTFLKGRVKAAAAIFSGAFAAAVTFFLCVASADYVNAMKPLGKTLVYGLPLWIVQLALPIGFGLITWRLLRHAAANWWGRGLTLLLAAGLVVLVQLSPAAPESLLWPALIVLVAAVALGAPVFTALGGAALILFWTEGAPVLSIPLKHYGLVTNPTLPSIPLFTLAGYFLAEGGASRRLVRVFQALVGQFRGGPAIVAALVCAFFTSFTGASGVTILALGGLLMPVLIAAKYSERAALGLLTGAGSLGLLFPPCLPLILYAIVANTSAQANITIEQMFLGGIGPGILLVLFTAWWGVRQGPRERPETGRFSWREAGRAIWAAKWDLLIPVVALTALFSGLATPVEAAAVTALYAFVVETVVHRDLKPGRDVPQVMTECGLLMGGVLLILGVALGFTYYLIDAQVPDRAVEWVTAAVHSRWVFLLAVNLFLLVVGCLMDIFSAIVVVVPLLVPLGNAFGVNPIHLGIIFLANLELGYLTPPVGMNLFLASYRFGKPMPEVIRAAFPMLLVLLAGVLLITYFPPLTTLLPQWFGH